MMTLKTNTPVNKLLTMIGLSSSKYYSWITRFEQPNNHTVLFPRNTGYLTGKEKQLLTMPVLISVKVTEE
jgi:hypothetical protein